MLAIEVLAQEKKRDDSQKCGNEGSKCTPCAHSERDFSPDFPDDSDRENALLGSGGFG